MTTTQPSTAPASSKTAWLVSLMVTMGSLAATLPVLVAPQVAHAQAKRSGATVTMNFVNAEIDGVARAVSAIINRQIIVDPRVKGAITLYSEQPVTPRDAYLNFLSALRGQGFALVEVAGLLKVVPEADAKLQSGTVEVGNKSKVSGDVVLTQIFKLQFENANNLVTVLRPLISPNNTINANPGTNSLVITDYADNLKRMGQIIAALDMPSTGEMEVVPLQFTVAADMAPLVQRLNAIDGGSGAGSITQPALVVADTRTNSLLIKSTSPSRVAAIKKLIAQLDRPGESGVGGSGIHVVYLKNADAVKLAQILRAAFPTSGGASGGSGSSATAASPVTPTPTASNTTGASAQSTSPVSASAAPSTGGNIQADPASNSLIITGPDALYRQLRAVIDQLDGRRAQLFIEAMIVEVNAEKLAQVGVQWQTILGQKGDANIIGLGTNFPITKTGSPVSSIISSAIPNATTVAAAAASKGFNIGLAHNFGDGKYGLAALASFLQSNADGNVLSSPNLVVLDNEEAKIVSGKNVPVPTGQTNTSGGTSNPFTTIDRKDVGLTLRVKPQIGENGTIRMTVFQENSNVESTSNDGPTTTKSSLETSVVVDDGTLLVLGGLIQEDNRLNKAKVPLLGDLPLLGSLFRSEDRTRRKSNLMIFLRPAIMRTQDASNVVTSERYEYMRQQQQAINPDVNVMLPLDIGTRLPVLTQPPTKPATAAKP